jgi:hypothetical protein
MKQAIALLLLISTTAVAQPKPPPKDPPKQDVPADPYGDTAPAPSARSHFDLSAVQGLLAVQRLDGWLLSDDGAQNPIARQLVNPDGAPARRWFYLIPANGDPIALVHTSEMNDFARTPGKHIAYTGYKDLEKGLRAILKGKKTIAMEYSPKGALPSIARTDAGTLELVRGLGVTVRGSEGLVAFTKALWGPEGRKAHYVAEHHLTELRKEALAYAAKQVAAGAAITEYDLQQRIVHGMQMRGLVGPPPVGRRRWSPPARTPPIRTTCRRRSAPRRSSKAICWSSRSRAASPTTAASTRRRPGSRTSATSCPRSTRRRSTWSRSRATRRSR